MRSALVLLLLASWTAGLGAPAMADGPVGPPNRYGLRYARGLDARTVRLTFGPSFVKRVAERPETYRIVCRADPAYRVGLRALAARCSAAPDDAPPAAWRGRRYERNAVLLTLPRPMRPGLRYAVQALGSGGQPVTGGRAAAWIAPMSDAEERRAAADAGLGVRAMEILAPTVVRLTVGDSFDTARFDGHPESIVLRSGDDAAFRGGRAAVRVGRASRGDCFQTDGWPYGHFLVHEVFAEFDKPLREGRAYTLDLNARTPLTSGSPRASLRVDSRATISPAIKVNQIGYLPDVPRRYAYLGAWMGSLGALDYGPPPRFEVRDAVSHAVLLRGTARLRHRAGERAEGPYHEDLSGENVCEMDLAGLNRPGRYYLALPGMGRSYDFRVASDVYAGPFRVMMAGVLHQRCGIEMRPPYSAHYRPACHRNRTELTDLPRGSEADAFRELPRHVIDPRKRDRFGGHHDAGDYNPRSHLDVAELAFLAYETNPGAFFDGQLPVPEAGNGIADILDEGRWALDLWVRLQEADGGVRNGTESDGDPDMTTLAEEDTRRDFAFASDAVGSLRFAASAAQAARPTPVACSPGPFAHGTGPPPTAPIANRTRWPSRPRNSTASPASPSTATPSSAIASLPPDRTPSSMCGSSTTSATPASGMRSAAGPSTRSSSAASWRPSDAAWTIGSAGARRRGIGACATRGPQTPGAPAATRSGWSTRWRPGCCCATRPFAPGWR